MVKKVITWAIVIFVVYWLATDASGAASAIHTGWGGLKTAAGSLANFIQSL